MAQTLSVIDKDVVNEINRKYNFNINEMYFLSKSPVYDNKILFLAHESVANDCHYYIDHNIITTKNNSSDILIIDYQIIS